MSIEQIVAQQKFQMITFYNAVSIADQYLNSLSGKYQKAPCIETLAVACVLIASKLDYSATNPYKVAPAQSSHRVVDFKAVLKLELDILFELEFEVSYPSQLDFFMRYSQLLQLQERIQNKRMAFLFEKVFTKLSTHIAKNSSYLCYTPAQTAAACLLICMNFTCIIKQE